MKERLEIVPCEERQFALRYKELGRPKKNWGKERSDDNDPDKVGRQFSYVFQDR